MILSKYLLAIVNDTAALIVSYFMYSVFDLKKNHTVRKSVITPENKISTENAVKPIS